MRSAPSSLHIRLSDNEQTARMAYEELFRLHNFKIDAFNPSETVLFPELEENAEVPEITESCWNILDKSPNDMMCSSSRMVVKRKGASLPSVVACTLLPYDLKHLAAGQEAALQLVLLLEQGELRRDVTMRDFAEVA